MMRRIMGIICMCLLGLQAMAQDCGINGKIENYKGGTVLFIRMTQKGPLEDTIKVNADGTFEYQFSVNLPGKAYITCMDEAASIPLFVVKGMKAELNIAFHQENYMGMMMNFADVDYKGDYADCFYFMDEYGKWDRNAWPFERMDTLTFTQFRRLLLKDLDNFHQKLAKMEQSAFRAMMEDEIGTDPTSRLIRYAWSIPRKDKVFADWMNSFDRNELGNIAFAFDYLRWYERENLPVKGSSYGVQHLANMEKLFDNQEVINALAADYMQKYFHRADDDIDEVWQAFQQTTTDKAAVEKLRSQYEYYTAFLPGKPAPDFEMTGTDGKVYRLSDFRGKALYIDVWATWCGPCCMEIPYIEKLVEHYRDNSKLEFLSISLDNNKETWAHKLKTDQPEWKQFICPDNFKSDLAICYGIKGIPRFLFIDKNGNIISIDAPRPSMKGIISYLNKHID